MGNKFLHPIIFVTSLLVSACKAQPVPVIPTPVSPADTPKPSSTATIGPFTTNGEFVLTNTSSPGMEVGIETMSIVLENRLSTDGQWEKVETECSFDPPAPTVLKKELVVKYECKYNKILHPNAELHTTVEVKIYGSDEVYKLEVNSP